MNNFFTNTGDVNSTHDVLLNLKNHDIDMVLVGSQIAKIFKICSNPNDIDFMINPAKNNVYNLYSFLNKKFKISNFHEFEKLDRYSMITKNNFEKEVIELFKIHKNNAGWFSDINYDIYKKNSSLIRFQNIQCYAVNLEYYINSIVIPGYNSIEIDDSKRKKYKNILQKYHQIYVQNNKSKNIEDLDTI